MLIYITVNFESAKHGKIGSSFICRATYNMVLRSKAIRIKFYMKFTITLLRFYISLLK